MCEREYLYCLQFGGRGYLSFLLVCGRIYLYCLRFGLTYCRLEGIFVLSAIGWNGTVVLPAVDCEGTFVLLTFTLLILVQLGSGCDLY